MSFILGPFLLPPLLCDTACVTGSAAAITTSPSSAGPTLLFLFLGGLLKVPSLASSSSRNRFWRLGRNEYEDSAVCEEDSDEAVVGRESPLSVMEEEGSLKFLPFGILSVSR